MKNRIRFAITLAGAALCALPNLSMAQNGSGDSQGGQAPSIEGTWIFNVQVAPGVAFTALQSFTAGGVAVATGSGDRTLFSMLSPGSLSPLYGAWSGADSTYTVTICAFTFDLTGKALQMFKTYETLRLMDNNNTLMGTGVGVLCDLNGMTGCASLGGPPIVITGKRLIAQGASN